MNEFKIINNYFKVLSKKNPSAKNLNDDVFFDKKSGLVVSIDSNPDKIMSLRIFDAESSINLLIIISN